MNYYDRITDMNVLYDAYRKCIKGVDWKSSVQRYEANFLNNLRELRKSLINGAYKPKPFTEFQITERGKTRQIKSPCLQDRILQRVMCDYVLEPVLYPYLIYDNGASVIEKGVEFTRKRLRRNLQNYYRKYGLEGYILIGDFSKYFESIPHDKLICSIAEKIHDEKFMQLFELIIKSFGAGKDTGIGIGAQISQICGIYYATPLDNYIRNVRGCSLHARHMDDFYVIHHDKQYLKQLLTEIEAVTDALGLQLNKKKTQICRIDKGFVFLKQRIHLTSTGRVVMRPCKDTVTRERRKLKKFKVKLENEEMTQTEIQNQYKSWRGGMDKYDCHKTLRNLDETYMKLFGGKE